MQRLILASRDDGLGERLRAMLNALYLAHRFNLEFGFVWHALQGSTKELCANELAPIIVPAQEEIFTQEFIQKYSFNGQFEDALDEFGRFKRKSIQEFITTAALNPPYRATQKRLDTIFNDINTQEYKKQMSYLFTQIGFNETFTKLIEKAKIKAKNLAKNTQLSVLHIRAGDAIFKKSNQNGVVRSSIYFRALSFPLAVEIIKEEIEANNTLLVFSDDLSLLKTLKKDLPVLFGFTQEQNNNLLFSIDLYENDELENPAHKAFYENVLMSYADRIYCTKNSGYANLAVLTGKPKEEIIVYEYFDLQSQYKLTEKYLDKINAHNFEKVFACFQAFRLSKELKMPLELSKTWLSKALTYDNENEAYRILWLDCLFLQGKIQEAENMLEKILFERKQSFLHALFSGQPKRYDYSFTFKHYLNHIKPHLPYISFVALQIAWNLGYDDLVYKNLKDFQSTKNSFIHSLFNTLEKPLMPLGAEYRMKNHLSYRLGEIMVKNSYSIFGIIKMPFILLQTYLDFKQKRLKACVSLRDYKDYERALKFVKNHAFYKLGFSLIKAQKTWYKGGYFYFFKEVRKLALEYEKERKAFKKNSFEG
ncbi:hypothetical protein CQA38_00505 [Campylobacter sp. MIT 12-5580]|uniref:hypothetical protein n=1 Tax=Campylobacter sp. MIT 12-5580 TaxID=2040651 RepID=UPI0010F8453B|nr:hypothetical protein [Campylobacter sp. MIT 12-5580]TKX30157.1 hypothetical protein CQA38_00505 [Campylobacter sp. MIT 12-5580]